MAYREDLTSIELAEIIRRDKIRIKREEESIRIGKQYLKKDIKHLAVLKKRGK